VGDCRSENRHADGPPRQGNKARLVRVGEPAVYAFGQWRELAPRGESLNCVVFGMTPASLRSQMVSLLAAGSTPHAPGQHYLPGVSSWLSS
jgi:hypothetical protein